MSWGNYLVNLNDIQCGMYVYRHFIGTRHIHHHFTSSHIYQNTRCHIPIAIPEKS